MPPIQDLIPFLILALVAIGSALGMIFSRNAIYSALNLIINLGTVAVFYLLLGAPFLAMVRLRCTPARLWCYSYS
jgi:NADH-quinone oxidoreductase subunit J